MEPEPKYSSLCTIIFDEVMEVEFPVIESEYSFINKGMPVGIIPFINDSILITGTITQINPQVGENCMVKVIAEFSNRSRIIDGMNVKVAIKNTAVQYNFNWTDFILIIRPIVILNRIIIKYPLPFVQRELIVFLLDSLLAE